MGPEISLMGIHQKEGRLTVTRIERTTPVLRPAIQSNQISLSGLRSSRNRRGKKRTSWPGRQHKKAADGRRQRRKNIIDVEREKYRVKNESLRNTSKKTTFLILINHASAPVRKKRLSPSSNVRREASWNECVEGSGMPRSVEISREVDRSKDRPKAHLGFVKSIWNSEKETELDWEYTVQGRNWPGGERK